MGEVSISNFSQFKKVLRNVKREILQRYWEKVKGFDRKATLVYSTVVAIQVMAIDALLNGIESLFRISSYRY